MDALEQGAWESRCGYVVGLRDAIGAGVLVSISLFPFIFWSHLFHLNCAWPLGQPCLNMPGTTDLKKRLGCLQGPAVTVVWGLDMVCQSLWTRLGLGGLFDIYELHQYLRHCSKHHSAPGSMRLQS